MVWDWVEVYICGTNVSCKKIFGDESRFLQFATLRGWALFIYLFSE